MQGNWPEGQKQRLEAKRDDLTARLERITKNVRRSLDHDSEERAKQLEDSEVVDALGNDAREELQKVSDALRKMDRGQYGQCNDCGSQIAARRMEAHPYAGECIDCAELDEEIRARR